MKGAFFVLALGALAAVHAEEDRKPGEGIVQRADATKPTPEDLNAIFNSGAGKVNWENFSPEALGMQLNYDEMSAEELNKVVDAFVQLGLISPEEKESFGASLVDPVMRSMLQTVQENWPTTMEKIMNDPDYVQFLKNFQKNIDEKALATIVGLKDGLRGAVKGKEEEETPAAEQ
ncbi:hypothetical protein, conserved [Eimeria praecox]|uniref:Eimeria-specific protein n=1 Tax=Eimeria praecox TaxID=51316 RepID=U6GN44_9EIME|nr:hypothetical protein, conserved [Eimeria praecox]